MEPLNTVNRLILVGNGFDLAHGLKTGYNDFIKWYLTQSLQHALNFGTYEDVLISVICQQAGDVKLSIAGINNVSDLVEHFYNEGFQQLLTKRYLTFKTWSNDFYNPFIIKPKMPLISELLINCSSATWVEIENTYYALLTQIFKGSLTKGSKSENIRQLNEGFAELIAHLQDYLNTLNTDKASLEYKNIIYFPFDPSEFTDTYPSATSIGERMVLNFNYTNTVEKYLNPFPSNTSLNFIHGQLGDKQNPIIFGFGDEMDETYSQFETQKTIGQFDYFKSFLYLQTSNYYNLLRFIQSNHYQVYILGHSCGLSDRTMLNMIFEHENCKSIKIYYYQSNANKNNYTPLTQEIARHFKNKQAMRGKIVSLDKSIPMPQVKT